MLRWKVVRCRSLDANDHEIFRVVMVPKIPKANDEGLYSFTGILMLSCGNGCQNPSRTTASPNTAGIPRLRMESLVEKHFHAQEIHEMFVVTEDVVYNNEFRVFPFMYINVAMIAKSDILGGDDVVASFSLPNMFESPGSQNKFERSRWYLLNNYLLLLSFRLAVNHCLADSCNANGTFHATCQTPPFLLNVTTQFFEEYGEANCCKWTTSTATVGKLMNERTVFGLAITQRVLEIKSVKVGAWFERVLGNDALWSALTHRTPYYGDMLRGRGMSYRLINKLCIGTIKFFSDGTMIVSMEMKEQMMQRNPLCQDQIMPFMKAPHPIEETKAIIFSMVAGSDITDILIPNHFITGEGVLMVILFEKKLAIPTPREIQKERWGENRSDNVPAAGTGAGAGDGHIKAYKKPRTTFRFDANVYDIDLKYECVDWKRGNLSDLISYEQILAVSQTHPVTMFSALTEPVLHADGTVKQVLKNAPRDRRLINALSGTKESPSKGPVKWLYGVITENVWRDQLGFQQCLHSVMHSWVNLFTLCPP